MLLDLDPNFQYPRSDRRRCNASMVSGSEAITAFQYPRSDRRRCNGILQPILVRPAGDFQYPRSDRRRCN